MQLRFPDALWRLTMIWGPVQNKTRLVLPCRSYRPPRGDTPVIKATGSRSVLNRTSALTLVGPLRFMARQSLVTEAVLRVYVRRLMPFADRLIRFVVGHLMYRATKVQS